MKRQTPSLLLLLLLLLLSLLLASCAVGPASPTPLTPSGTPTTTPTQISEPTATITPWPASEGPALLLQTDFDRYAIIDFGLGLTYPVALPGVQPDDRLGGILSPSGSKLLLTGKQGSIQILNLVTGSTETVETPTTGPFQPEQAAAAALDALTGMKYSYEAALEAVKSAYGQSISIARWGEDDEQLFVVSGLSETGTQLTRLDLSTGERALLEREPGMLENFWVRDDKILLKKGYIFEPGFWQDDAYTVIDRGTGGATAIPLPADADRPAIGWLGPDNLKITHQTEPAGGIGFSIMDLEALTWQTIVPGPFTSISAYPDGWLLFEQDTATRRTTVQRLSSQGDPLLEATLPERCFLNDILGETILVNCETESLKLDGDLTVEAFSAPIFLLSGAPDGHAWVLVTRTEGVYLLDSGLAVQNTLALNSVPLEVRWLPDSSGFLYRTNGRLYHYILARGISQELLVSDLLNDYTNMNAVWINRE